MEQIIKKAIEGGYKDWEGKCEHTIFEDEGGCPFSVHYKAGVIYVCDALFWQALGKECGWQRDIHGEGFWLDNALEFQKINLTEGWDKAVDWLYNLIN